MPALCKHTRGGLVTGRPDCRPKCRLPETVEVDFIGHAAWFWVCRRLNAVGTIMKQIGRCIQGLRHELWSFNLVT